jgi:hypothetical protein
MTIAMRILRGLSSRRLACGCLVGLYETYDGQVAHILDHRDPTCANPRHRPGERLAGPEGPSEETADPAGVASMSR